MTTTAYADGMRIEFDVAIEMDDGLLLRADVFRPATNGVWPVIMTMGPYAKGLAFEEGWKFNWDKLVTDWPEVAQRSTNKYQNWETVDPERWVPDGYVCVRVDSRGAGRSPGYLDPWSPREARDFYTCIEWAGTQPWSTGKVGLAGISYYAMNQWHVAALRPPHLSAMIVQEGAADYYRDVARHGGILSQFVDGWYRNLYATVQHGCGDRSFRSQVTGEAVAGPETLTAEEMARSRSELFEEIRGRDLIDDYYRDRTADLERIVVPLLSCGNWGGQGLHPRGNVEGFLRAGSSQKWLEMHGDTHSSPFYTDHGVAMQKDFFGHFLRDEDNGWNDRPRVMLRVRHPGEVFIDRGEAEWPLARTQWTRFYLDPETHGLGRRPGRDGSVQFAATGDGVVFQTEPLVEEVEVTGPASAHLTISSDTPDADLFLCFQVFDENGVAVTFQGSNDPRTPVGLGWLRASHRKLDKSRTEPHRPFHAHDERWPLTPGVPVELDVEIWPTSIVIPPGYRLALAIRGVDYDNGAETPSGPRYPLRGVGPFTHADQGDRPREVFGGTTSLHFTEESPSYLLLPVIPKRCELP